jgi:Uri superfamily endonuclease
VETASMEMRAMPGTYALWLYCPRPARVTVGAVGECHVTVGWFVYIGSAFGSGGVRARCARHARGGKRHWHIDYLRGVCHLREIWFSHDGIRREHAWAELLATAPGSCLPFPGFGSSDCSCPAHLYFFPRKRPAFAGFRRRLRAAIPGHAPLGCCVVDETGPE